MKRPKHRVFDYPPRFYKPEEDERERKKRRLGFSRQRKFGTRKRNPLIWLVLLILIVYIYLKLSGVV
jgi:hypothetical protein